MLGAISRFKAAPTSAPVNDKSNDRSEIFENVPLGSNPGFAIRDSKIGGKGVFATREFKAGDVIMREDIVLTVEAKQFDEAHVHVEAALSRMTANVLARFLSLHNEHSGNCCAVPLPHRASEIYQSNMLMLTSNIAGLGFHASRFNHSCEPNARHTFNAATKKLEMRALSPIRKGEEVFITYNGSEITPSTPRAKRQAELRKRYHFTCACAVCKQASAPRVLVDRIVQALWTKRQQKVT